MEIDAVAECNGTVFVKPKKTKATPYINYHNYTPRTHSELHNNTKLSDMITASLLAISDTADQDFYNFQKPRKRPSPADQFGPWISDEKWSPRKRGNGGQNGGRGGKKNLNSTNGGHSSTPRFGFAHGGTSDESPRHSLRYRNGNTQSTITLPEATGITEETVDHGQFQKNEVGNNSNTNIINQNNKRSIIRPLTVPTQSTISSAQKAHHNYSESDQPSNGAITNYNNNTDSECYQKHSIPALITLRPANSSNEFHTVFCLEKTNVIPKDIIVSMGQTSKMSTHFSRQFKSASALRNVSFQNGDNQESYSSQPMDEKTSQEQGNGHDDVCKTHRSKVIDACVTRRPVAPMCEHEDISQHIKFYRMYNTVRMTGRYSLANEDQEKKEIKPVQWDEVFPHRPLSNTTKRVSSVPVFRFTVSDFCKEQHLANQQSDYQSLHNQTYQSKTQTTNTNNTNKSINTTRAEINKFSIINPNVKARIARTSVIVGDEIYISTTSKAKSSKKETKISLEPTVTPVSKGPKPSMNVKSVDSIENGKSYMSELIEPFYKDEGEDDGKEGYGKRESSNIYHNRHHNVLDNNTTMYKEDDGDMFHDGIDTKRIANMAQFLQSENEASYSTRTKHRDSNFDNASELRMTNESRKPNDTTTRLAKTQAYIRSTFSVYNDTIQPATNYEPSQGNDYYRDYLRRRNESSNHLDQNNDRSSSFINSISERDPKFTEGNMTVSHEILRPRVISPHRLSLILRDTLGHSRMKSSVYKSTHDGRKRPEDNHWPITHVDIKRRSSLSTPGGMSLRSGESSRAPSGTRPILTIDEQLLHDSVNRKLRDGNSFVSRLLASRNSTHNNQDCSDRFVRFLIKDEEGIGRGYLQKRSSSMSQGQCHYSKGQKSPKGDDYHNRNGFSGGRQSRSSVDSEKDGSRNTRIGTASMYDLDVDVTAASQLEESRIASENDVERQTAIKDCMTIQSKSEAKEEKDKSLSSSNQNNSLHQPVHSYSSPSSSSSSSITIVNAKKVWKPETSHLNRKSYNNKSPSDNRMISSAFHFRPTPPTSSSAYVIATPPLQQLGFDERGIVIPLDEFVQLAMKDRESSFSVLSQSMNAGSRLGIGPNNITSSTKGRAGSVRKSADEGLVRVVSFATPVNQFIFAKRITGYPLATNTSTSNASFGSVGTTVAEDAGRNMFQRKSRGSFRLSMSDLVKNKAEKENTAIVKNDKKKKDTPDNTTNKDSFTENEDNDNIEERNYVPGNRPATHPLTRQSEGGLSSLNVDNFNGINDTNPNFNQPDLKHNLSYQDEDITTPKQIEVQMPDVDKIETNEQDCCRQILENDNEDIGHKHQHSDLKPLPTNNVESHNRIINSRCGNSGTVYTDLQVSSTRQNHDLGLREKSKNELTDRTYSGRNRYCVRTDRGYDIGNIHETNQTDTGYNESMKTEQNRRDENTKLYQSLLDKKKLHSMLRRKVVNLTEKSDATINSKAQAEKEEEEDHDRRIKHLTQQQQQQQRQQQQQQQLDLPSNQNQQFAADKEENAKMAHSSLPFPVSRYDDVDIEEGLARSHCKNMNETLASKFSRLRERRKKLMRHPVINKQARLVQKSWPRDKRPVIMDATEENNRSTSGRPEMTSSIRADGLYCVTRRDSIGETIPKSRSGNCQKVVRFACDEDISISASKND